MNNRTYTIVYSEFVFNFDKGWFKKISQVQVEAPNYVSAKLKAMEAYNLKAKQILRCL